ncbi:SDR family oxidoreductase [Mucilaginibacter limnophilus]|uniref:SDR family oxidoreductase n=1 Tax=Mucilaginibacter limnophilus TaxID=1932778 RepID=A0A3S2UJH8_9SPHI|nr:SDR family oxidoreductase [Mucilaginibacter limnophilus]RVT97281.1 SDR family oxidoreductase [Mucilaginibacter limnophilus]
MDDIKTISILGCGWYGLPLAKLLVSSGYIVKGSVTSTEKLEVLTQYGIQPYLVNFTQEEESYNAVFFDCDVLWIAIPPKTRSGEGDSYVNKIDRIADAAGKFGIKKVIYISSTGVYGDHNREVDENTSPEPISQSGKILWQAEEVLRKATAFKSTIIRFGGLIGPGRDPGRFFAGKKNLPNGKAPVNLIHLDDCLGISNAILRKNFFGYTLNACSPQHPEKALFYIRAAESSKLEKPEFIDQLSEWKIVNSIYIENALGYRFTVPLI